MRVKACARFAILHVRTRPPESLLLKIAAEQLWRRKIVTKFLRGSRARARIYPPSGNGILLEK